MYYILYIIYFIFYVLFYVLYIIYVINYIIYTDYIYIYIYTFKQNILVCFPNHSVSYDKSNMQRAFLFQHNASG